MYKRIIIYLTNTLTVYLTNTITVYYFADLVVTEVVSHQCQPSPGQRTASPTTTSNRTPTGAGSQHERHPLDQPQLPIGLRYPPCPGLTPSYPTATTTRGLLYP